MEDIQQEDQEAPFEYVKSKRRPKNPHRRPPPAATSGSSSSSSSAGKAGTSYSNSSSSITGAGHGGFTYSAISSSMRGGRKKGKNRNGIRVVLSEEEEAQRALSRACGMVDVFVRYLSSELHLVPDENGDEEGKVKDGGARGRSYAGKMRDCFEAVWPPSFHRRADLHNNTAKQDQREDTEESHNEQKEASKAKEQVNRPIPSKIVCLGLGSPLTSKSAQIQLALLVVLRRWISLLLGATTHSTTSQEENEEEGREEKGRVSESIAVPSEVQGKEWSDARWEEVDQGRDGVECVAYDPVFTALDDILLSRYGVYVARSATDTSANAKASQTSTSTATSTPDSNPTPHRSIEPHYTAIKTPTLLYMPHCDRELYEHILSLNYPPSPPPIPSPSSTPSPPFPPSQDIPIVLLSNVLTNYATFTSNLETSSPTLSRLLNQFTVQEVPNWDSGKRSALIQERKEVDQMGRTEETIGDFVKGWDRNALRDLAFHWL